jgi:hypothetical protein
MDAIIRIRSVRQENEGKATAFKLRGRPVHDYNIERAIKRR